MSIFESSVPTAVLQAPSTRGVALLDAPTAIESEVEMEFPFRQHSVEIYSAVDQEIVTVIEILSPVNKRVGHEAYDHYVEKRRKILNVNSVHLIEIDLLRGGRRPPLIRPVPEAPYYIMLSRTETRPRVLVWPIQLHEPLPIIQVPLRQPDADIELPLANVFTTVYDNGAYDVQLDYAKPVPPPPLSARQQAWVDQLLQRTN